MFSRNIKQEAARQKQAYISNLAKAMPGKTYEEVVEAQQYWTKRFIEEERAELKSELSDPVAFIGINPPSNSISLRELYEQCLTTLTDQGEAVVEQNTSEGIRPHVHYLCKVSSNARKNHLITKYSKLFNLPSNFISVQISKNAATQVAWNKYVSGDKQQSKSEFVELDFKDREKLGIPHKFSLL